MTISNQGTGRGLKSGPGNSMKQMRHHRQSQGSGKRVERTDWELLGRVIAEKRRLAAIAGERMEGVRA